MLPLASKLVLNSGKFQHFQIQFWNNLEKTAKIWKSR